MTYEHDVTQI